MKVLQLTVILLASGMLATSAAADPNDPNAFNDPNSLIDCNENGIADDLDIACNISSDVNTNGVPDGCESLIQDVVTIELTLHNDTDSVTDAVCAPITIHNDLTVLNTEANARQFTVYPFLLGDMDQDGFVNTLDGLLFMECLAGPDVFDPPAGCDAQVFILADIDDDDDVDEVDLTDFQTRLEP